MKLLPNLCTLLIASAFLLSGTVALAQASSTAREMHPRDGSTGLSTGRAAIPPPHAASATPSAQAKSPLYHEGSSGTNPLYESKDKTNIKPNSGASTVEYKDPEDMTTRYRPGNNKTTKNDIAVDHAGGNGVQRMDGSRTASGGAGESGMSAGADATARQKKHLGGVKYADRTSGGGNQMQTPRSAAKGSRH